VDESEDVALDGDDCFTSFMAKLCLGSVDPQECLLTRDRQVDCIVDGNEMKLVSSDESQCFLAMHGLRG